MTVVPTAPVRERAAAPVAEMPVSAFDRLRLLLHGEKPPEGKERVFLHLGEIGLALPLGLLGPLARAEDWCRYPPLGGTDALRRAYEGWLARRFGVSRVLRESGLAWEPTPGSKQALAVLVALATQRARMRRIERPAVVLPNPFYPTYLSATRAAGAEPIFYPVRRGELGQAIGDALARAAGRAAAVILCNPGFPEGDIVEEADQVMVAGAAANAGATLIVDECYADVFATQAPSGLLSLCERGLVAPCNLIVLHTLSKRSGAPGLRSGFAIGAADAVARYASHNRSCGVSSPFPVCETAAALWSDETHVQRLRDAIARNWDLADRHLSGIPGYRRAQTGFFLWLAVDDGEAVACRLWRCHALMVMPGRYLAASDERGVNPGSNRLRVALIQEPESMAASLRRLRAALLEHASQATQAVQPST